jgi:sialate O-acetylesterase
MVLSCAVVSIAVTQSAVAQAQAESQKELSVHSLFTDNGVLQQNQPVPIWGTAPANAEVTVEFKGQKVATKATESGDWMISLNELIASSKPADMTIRGQGESIVVSDLLVGEVWICSGQSNMVMPLQRTLDHDTVQSEIMSGSLNEVRLFKVPVAGANERQANVQARWSTLDRDSAARFSATGLYFGRALSQELKVPIGLIQAANGGTNAYSWINSKTYQDDFIAKPTRKFWDETISNSRSKLAQYRDNKIEWQKKVTTAKQAGEKPTGRAPREPLNANHVKRPTGHYNAMIAPLQPFAIAGVVWYQGEANTKPGFANNYKDLMLGLVDDWRDDWAEASNAEKRDFPFYVVQLPNFAGGHKQGWPLVREQMLKFWIEGNNTGMVTTIDVGQPNDIHPKNKMPVGDRLAIFALGNHYQYDVEYAGPILKSVKVEDGKGVFTFQHARTGICSLDGEPLRHFQIADAAGNFVDAKAVIEGDRLLVSSSKIAAPHAVRYAWSNNPERPNFGNKAGLLASPFRTDRWKIKVD